MQVVAIETLVDLGCHVSVKDSVNSTPVHVAAGEGHLEAVAALHRLVRGYRHKLNRACDVPHVSGNGCRTCMYEPLFVPLQQAKPVYYTLASRNRYVLAPLPCVSPSRPEAVVLLPATKEVSLHESCLLRTAS